MLMRNLTRIEFKPEDAQEYIKKRQRERASASQVQPVQTGRVQPLHWGDMGLPRDAEQTRTVERGNADAAVAAHDSLAAQGLSRSSGIMSSIVGGESVSDESFERELLQAGQRDVRPDATQHEAVQAQTVQPFQQEVEQLMTLGFREEDARQALSATGGDLEAAADRLLL
eukprot:TRINITY_DN99263_c0_g1_i1.p1 TRINITY_DN99263_c0_g1~~TRINITY_DN99263_c0_g1_i1.p1  ORF type:complete len:181 (+),score=40.32 TRINITY_DN99263_c0_g1_i1:35-544(+)